MATLCGVLKTWFTEEEDTVMLEIKDRDGRIFFPKYNLRNPFELKTIKDAIARAQEDNFVIKFALDSLIGREIVLEHEIINH